MIVLRIDVRGHSADVRWAAPTAVLGSGEDATIAREDAGWAPREAMLVHLGSELLVVRADGSGETRLRPGDALFIGGARVTLLGLAPLPGAEVAEPTPVPASDLGRWTPTLVDEPARTATTPPVPTPPARKEAGARPATRPAAAAASAAPGARAAPSPASAPATATVAAPVHHGAAAQSFGGELVAALRQSPWFALSAALHALVFTLLAILAPATTARDDGPRGIVVSDARLDESLGGEPVDEPDAAPEPLTAPDVEDLEKLAELDAIEAERRSIAPRPIDPVTDLLPEPVEVAMPPPLVGPSGGAVKGFVTRVSPKTATTPAVAEPMIEDADRSLEMNRRAAAKVRDALTRGGGGLGRALKGLRAQDLLVVKGTFDKMELVLDELRVPYTLASPAEVARDDLRSRRVVFWNCMDPETALPPRSRPAILAHLREFVARGGYLFTTDWGVGTVVMLAFPGTVVTSGSQRTLPEMILEVTPKLPEHPLLEGVFPTSGRVHWWLESASQDVMLVPGADVEVLIEGKELAAAGRSPIVAVTFRHGQGRVLHVMGHYYQQKGHVDGAVAAQRLALNFLRESVERQAAATTTTTK